MPAETQSRQSDPRSLTVTRYLVLAGWQHAGTEWRRGRGKGEESVTWWRKGGHEIPQHLAVWLQLMAHGRPDLVGIPHGEVFVP